MRCCRVLALGVLVSATTAPPLHAQHPDYLTTEEVQQVRDTQEPSKRVQLFLTFADLRLQRFENKLAPSAESGKPRRGDLQDALNDYIRSIDDAAGNLEEWLERGGVDLRKLRKPLKESCTGFLTRLNQIRDRHRTVQDDLRWDMEDALEATQDLLDLGKKIPDKPVPVRSRAGQSDPDRKPQPGRPTLKRKDKKPPP